MTETDFSDAAVRNALMETLKGVDPDRYRAALMAGDPARDRLLTLYAFHYELAKVPEMVSEPMIGAIRYQWWRDAVAEIYEDKPVRKHEVATPLKSVLLECDVPRYWVDALIDGRERDLDPRPFESLDAAKDYCAATSGKLMQIAVQVAAPDLELTEARADGVAKAGLAWGLTGLARAYRHYQTRMLSELAFDDIRDAAREAYEHAGRALGKVNTALMPAIAYASLTPKYLSRMSGKFDPSKDSVTYGPAAKQLRLMRAGLTGRI